MRIYTKTGDTGDTALFGGGRVSKDHPRVEAYGAVDELNSAVAFARSAGPLPVIDDLLMPIQRDLFSIGALLATPDRLKMQEQLAKAKLDDARVRELEQAIDAAERELEPLRAFVLPGGTMKACALHIARTVCRRAERRVVALKHETTPAIPDVVIVYLNRLSDLLFVLARQANKRAGEAEVQW